MRTSTSMHGLIAFDKFKDALSAEEACRLVGDALLARAPGTKVDLCPLTDGGEGFARILAQASGGTLHPMKVTGPVGTSVEGEYGLVPWNLLAPKVRARLGIRKDGQGVLGLVDMASASGLARIPRHKRNPWGTSSRGTGELLLAAAGRGADPILLGAGGSGTSDLGIGCLQALGLCARDPEGREITPLSPDHWERVESVECLLPERFPRICVACDVTNSLLGPRGAVQVYGPQKGLAVTDLDAFESLFAAMARRLFQLSGRQGDYFGIPGAGAAGGIGFGLMVLAGAELVRGSDLVSEWLDLPERIRSADVVLTGEGRFDRSSLEGKGPAALVARALELGKKVHVFAGSIEPGLKIPSGLTVHAVSPPDLPLEKALPQTGERLIQAVQAVDWAV